MSESTSSPDPSPREERRPESDENRRPRPHRPGWFHRLEQRVHSGTLGLLHMTADQREEQVHVMLANRQRGVVEYWTFLMLSMAIATLGLAMDSTTVVIGAMLVSPLMGPIVEFAMGLVVGSPVLTVRSVLRILGSVLLVILGAALMTLILPFHEVTSEIAARTEPTLMDLALAGFVALAATLTVVKARSETNIVAAGAAIGIALVPPVCVVGFGLGIGDLDIAGGASLLLVTNFTAIIFVGVVFFYLLGYERVSVKEWDDEALAEAAPGSYLRVVLMGADRVFGSSRSRLFRVAVPALVFGLLALPLSKALDRVSWEVRARSAVRRILAELPAEHDYFETSSTVSNGKVGVRTYVMGGSVGATDSLRSQLATRIAAATGVEPDVRVIAVPNYGALRRVLLEQGPAEPVADPPPDVELAGIRQDLATALERAWPSDVYGPLLGWWVELSDQGTVALRIEHLGPAPDAGAARLLTTALGPDAPSDLQVHFTAVDTARVWAPPEAAASWLPSLTGAVETVRAGSRVVLCVQLPEAAALGRTRTDAHTVADVVPHLLGDLPADRYGLRSEGAEFAFRLRAGGGSTDEEGDPPPTRGTVSEASNGASGEGPPGDGAPGEPAPAGSPSVVADASETRVCSSSFGEEPVAGAG